jgi:hypothetical protein
VLFRLIDYRGSEAKFKFCYTIYLAEIRNLMDSLNAVMTKYLSVAELIAERLK